MIMAGKGKEGEGEGLAVCGGGRRGGGGARDKVDLIDQLRLLRCFNANITRVLAKAC